MSPTPDTARLQSLADQAQALDRQAVEFHNMGQRDEAAVAAKRAVATWHELHRHLPGETVKPHLAGSLNNAGLMLGEAGRRAEALAATEEAVELYLELARANPQAFAPNLARSLNNLGNSLSAIGQRGEARAAVERAVELFRDLACANSQVFTPELATSLKTLGGMLRAIGRREQALAATEEAVGRFRELTHASPQAFMPDLAGSLDNLGVMLSELGQRDEALAATEEAVGLYRELARANPQRFTPDLAASLNNLGNCLSDLGRRDEALAAAEESVALRRELARANPQAFTPSLSGSLDNLGVILSELGRSDEALAATEEAVGLYRELARAAPQAFTPDLATSLSNLAGRLSELGRREEALAAAEEGVGLYRELACANPQAFTPDLARSLKVLGTMHSELGRREQALAATEEAVGQFRELTHASPQAFMPDLAGSLDNLGVMLSELGQRDEALAATEEAVGLYRELARAAPQAFTPDLAASLSNLAGRLSELGRREEALAAAEESVALRRELARANPQAFTPDLARSLNNLGVMLSALSRLEEALATTEEAVGLYRELARAAPRAFTPDLATSLNNFGIWLGEAGRRAEALAAAEESVALRRELARANPQAFTPDLARSLNNLGVMLSALSRLEEALATTEEAVGLYRELARAAPQAFTPDLATSLNNFGIWLGEAGRRAEALEALREVGACVLELPPDDPHLWSRLCRVPVRALDGPRDLRDFHLRLLGLLTDHRELAWNTEHARVFLDLQAEVAARVWELLGTLPAEEADLLDEAVAALVAAMQSPDLARWIDARGSGSGPLARLAELKREVIEAEQLLAALRKGLTGGDGGGIRTGSFGPGTDEQRAALSQELDRQSANAQALRQAFRDERARLVAEDPRFAAAFAPLGPQTLRSIAQHAQGGALLCVLEFGGPRDSGSSSAEAARAVAALLHADGRRTRLLELADVSDLAWHAERYVLEGGDRRRGPLRGAPPVATRSTSAESAADATDPVKGITELFVERMSRSFWAPLQQALHESGVAIERLHVCLHGTTQQLPLALRQDDDCPGVQIVPWPGLPYLRRAAMAAGAATTDAAKAPTAPWLIGHDCAWATEQPLPMVAVEAALLCDLLQRHGQPVQAVQLAAQVHGRASALVACCHGGAEQAQFDHALHLGAAPLTVRQIVQDNIGPPLALLPACHAGRTDEDAAGNALGVAAAFMLSGTRVVAASSKAVPDLLQPWLSTLTVWHAMQGMPHHEAATLAREQFASLHFPEGYRVWLQQALPQALATIQPGGEEDPHIRGPHADAAMETVAAQWPWEGDAEHIFHADRARREESTRSVVHGVLTPRGGEEGAHALAAEAREMSAFVFVYGVAQDGATQGQAAGAAGSAEPASSARAEGLAADFEPEAGTAPSAASTSGDVTTRGMLDPLQATAAGSGLLRRLRRLIGK